jgi:hypothetical protein
MDGDLPRSIEVRHVEEPWAKPTETPKPPVRDGQDENQDADDNRERPEPSSRYWNASKNQSGAPDASGDEKNG